MRRTRFMSWSFLVLSLAFFAVRNFRYALEAPLANSWWESQFSMEVLLSGGPRHSRLENLYTLKRYASPEKLLALADEAARNGDNDFVAFVALNLPDRLARTEGVRLADQAVHADRKLTWIFYFLDNQFLGAGDRNYQIKSDYGLLLARAARLHEFDPDNAVPHLLAAQLNQAYRGNEWPQYKKSLLDPEYLRALAAETEWRKEMDAAFASPRYDSYYNQRFDLLRRVMRQRHWDHPAVMVTLCEGTAIPNLLPIRSYANVLVSGIGADAEARGHLKEAIGSYSRADEFGKLMRLQAPTLIERLIGIACQVIAHQRLIPALKKAGRGSEADLLAYVDQQTKDDLRNNRPFYSGSSHDDWSVLLVFLSAGMVAAFALLTAVLVLYVNAKRWFRKDQKGRVFEFMTTAENYAPILLFVSCLSLYLNFVPYGYDYTHYMTSNDPYSSFPPNFYAHMYPSLNLLSGANFLSAITFMDYVLYALGGLAVLSIVGIILHFRSPSESQKRFS
jgi:hypothetical protein